MDSESSDPRPDIRSAEWSNAVVAARLRAAGCVFAEEEAALLLEAAGARRGGVDAKAAGRGELDTGALDSGEPDSEALDSEALDSEALDSKELDSEALESMIAQRVAGLPLEHILGWAEFAGLRIAVGPGVFVPRRRTGFLLQLALAAAGRGAVVLDLCCGSGALGAAMAAAGGEAFAEPDAGTSAGGSADTDARGATRADVDAGADADADTDADTDAGAATASPFEVYAADIDPAAVRSARRNLPEPGRVFEGDLYDALPPWLRGRIDVLVVNAPYVPTDAIATMPPEARLHEARIALDGGDDGLDVQRRVAADAADWLSPTGTLLIETSEAQAPTTAAIFAAAGLHPRIEHSDDLDATVVIATPA